MRILIVFLMLILPISVNAESIFDIQNETYIENVSELPPSTDLVPDKAWQPSLDWVDKYCHRDLNPYFVYGWLDIVGFKNTTKIGNIAYINESPEEVAIVRYETNACTMAYPRYNGGWNHKLELYQEGENLVAKLTAAAIMYYRIDGHKYFDNITKVFYDYEPIPKQINKTGSTDIEVTVREQNFTIINTTEISIKIDNTVYDRYLIRTSNGFYEKINRVWHVESTSKGVYFVNESIIDIFNSDNLSHIRDSVIISDLNFSVTASGFYYSTNQTNVTKISQTSDPLAQFMNLDLIGFLMVLSAFGVFIIHVKRQIIE